MDDLERKSALLAAVRFSYDFRRGIYVNRSKKEIVSLEFIDDHTPDELADVISSSESDDWRFYFNAPPTDSLKHQILTAMQQ